MKKIFSLLIWILTLAQVACTSNKNAEADKNTGTFNDTSGIEILRFPENGEDTLRASSFADTVIYVSLETNPQTFLKRFRHVWVDGSIILISDVHKLLMFSRDGKFIRQIGKKGKGPGEHQLIFNFDVYQDTVFLSSSGKRSLLKYTLDGIFCEEIPFKGQPVFFSRTDDGKFTWYQSQEGKIYIHNNDLNEADTIMVEYGVTVGRYKYVHLERFMTYFQKTSSGLLFNNYMNDTVWKIGNEKKEPAFILKMRDKLLPRDKQIEFSEGDFKRWEKMAKSYQMVQLMPFSTQMFIFQKHYYEEKYSAIYIQNMATKKMIKSKTPYIFEDVQGQQKLSNFIFTSSPDLLVAVIEPFELQEDLKTNKENIKEKASTLWFNQMKTVDKNNNPILVLIKIKKGM